MSWWSSPVRYGKSVWYHSAGPTSWDSFLFAIHRASCDIVTEPPLADQELHNAGDNSPTQGCREEPRPVEEHCLTWFLVLVVFSKKGVCNKWCHQKRSVFLTCLGDNDPATALLILCQAKPVQSSGLGSLRCQWKLRACLLVCHGSLDKCER